MSTGILCDVINRDCNCNRCPLYKGSNDITRNRGKHVKVMKSYLIIKIPTSSI